MTDPLTIRELTADDDIAAAFGLMSLLRTRLSSVAFVPQVRAQRQGGYRLFGGFTADGRLVALAGARDGLTLSRGPHLFVDDLVTHPDERGNGYGARMLRHLARDARARNLPTLWLDSRDTAVGFYRRLGFAFSTSVPCSLQVDALLGPT